MNFSTFDKEMVLRNLRRAEELIPSDGIIGRLLGIAVESSTLPKGLFDKVLVIPGLSSPGFFQCEGVLYVFTPDGFMEESILAHEQGHLIQLSKERTDEELLGAFNQGTKEQTIAWEMEADAIGVSQLEANRFEMAGILMAYIENLKDQIPVIVEYVQPRINALLNMR